MKIGFVGMGVMGRAMVFNLIKANINVTIFNRTKEKCLTSIKAGAKLAQSSSELITSSDIILTCVSNSSALEDIIDSGSINCDHISSDKILIDCSTISPSETIRIASILKKKNIDMLDAPVTGGEIGALLGNLTFMVGGKRKLFDKIKYLLDIMGETIIYAGVNGNGQKLKIVNQAVCAINALAVAEGLTLSKKLNIDLDVLYQLLSNGAANSWMVNDLINRLLQKNRQPGFTIKLFEKDMCIVDEELKRNNLTLDGLTTAHNLMRKAVSKGLEGFGVQTLSEAL